MWEIGDTIRLAFTTIHHSVALMDTFFSKVKDIEMTTAGKEFLQLIALTSIFISAKFWQKDSRGPTAANIFTLTKGQYSENKFLIAKDWCYTLSYTIWLCPICFDFFNSFDFLRTS